MHIVNTNAECFIPSIFLSFKIGGIGLINVAKGSFQEISQMHFFFKSVFCQVSLQSMKRFLIDLRCLVIFILTCFPDLRGFYFSLDWWLAEQQISLLTQQRLPLR